MTLFEWFDVRTFAVAVIAISVLMPAGLRLFERLRR